MTVTDVTILLERAGAGDSNAREELAGLLYRELRRLAGNLMRGERVHHTLQPTALVHEAWLRLSDADCRWENRAHFFGAAAQAMRRILVDAARARLAQKRGGGAAHATIADVPDGSERHNPDVLALHQALASLKQAHPRVGRVIELRYFDGLSIKETAAILGVPVATVRREWSYGRAWLVSRLRATTP